MAYCVAEMNKGGALTSNVVVAAILLSSLSFRVLALDTPLIVIYEKKRS